MTQTESLSFLDQGVCSGPLLKIRCLSPPRTPGTLCLCTWFDVCVMYNALGSAARSLWDRCRGRSSRLNRANEASFSQHEWQMCWFVLIVNTEHVNVSVCVGSVLVAWRSREAASWAISASSPPSPAGSQLSTSFCKKNSGLLRLPPLHCDSFSFHLCTFDIDSYF